MRLILARHGHDIARPNGNALSSRGVHQVQETAELLFALGVTEIDVACASPSQRAKESLDQFLKVLSFADRTESPELSPGSTVDSLERLLDCCCRDGAETVLFVGHEPQLSNAVLSWCNLPENDANDASRRPWMLSRGEALLVRPACLAKGDFAFTLSSELITFTGRERPISDIQKTRLDGTFG